MAIRTTRRGRSLLPLLLALLPCCSRSGRPGPAPRPDIVLVVLDTVRGDFTGIAGGGESRTPRLDALAAGATVFPNAFAVAPWTVPSHASMFTGLLPSGHGCDMGQFRLREDLPTLARILRASGYETAAFFSNPWLSDGATGLLRDFELSRETPVGGLDVMSRGRGDKGGPELNRGVAAWLGQRRGSRSGRKPLFLFVNYLEAHLPYDVPERERPALRPEPPPGQGVSIRWAFEFLAGLHPPGSVDWPRVRDAYGEGCRAADENLGALLEVLEGHGLLDGGVLIVTSDHGENLGDHGLVEHQFSVHETLLRVPFLLRAPGRLPAGVREEPVLLTDVFATVLDAAGVRDVPAPGFSRSWLAGREAGAERFLPAEYPGAHLSLLEELGRLNPSLDTAPLRLPLHTVRRGSLRLTAAGDGRAWLHDLARDPGQLEDRLAEAGPSAMELEAFLRELRSARPPSRSAAEELDEATKERLRSLGYVN